MGVFSHSTSVVLAGSHIDGFPLGIRHIAFIFQLPQVVAATLQILDVDIASIVAGVLADRLISAVIQDERDTVESFPCGTVRFVDEDAGDCTVGYGQDRGFPRSSPQNNAGYHPV